jgi:hypothetical protein
MSSGYIYCFSNPSMPGMVKVGMTDRTPPDRAKELYTTGVASPFKIEFAKKVSSPSAKEKTLHLLLEQYTTRINCRREFFSITPEKARMFFDLMDGEMWVDNDVSEIREQQNMRTLSLKKITEDETQIINHDKTKKRCDAYEFALVINETTGKFEPKQCSHYHDEGSRFCKKHGSVHGKRDDAASKYHGTEVFYEFKWQLCGSVSSGPTFVYEKFRDKLLAKFAQQSDTSHKTSVNECDVPSTSSEEEETDRIFNETHKVWIDNEKLFYYETEDSEIPIGLVQRGKMVPFKTTKAKTKEAN